jgi:RIP metalloprotease RseP
MSLKSVFEYDNRRAGAALVGHAETEFLYVFVGTQFIVDRFAQPAGSVVVLMSMLNLLILLSSNIGVMNLLPLPALDGGRLVFLIAELILRRKVPRKFEAIVTLVGFGTLMLLMVLVLVNDVSRFFRK